MDSNDSAAKEGVILGLLAYTLWGLFPIYFKWIDSAVPAEALVHRVIWAIPFGGLIILVRRQWADVRRAMTDISMLFWLALAAFAIVSNWWIYIWAVTSDRILDASLGYYISPMMYVLVGVAFFAEKLRRLQLISVALAVVGVVILTVSRGEFPWVAVGLAALFTIYGVIRRKVAIGAMPGLFVETVVLFPVAVVWLLFLMSDGTAMFLNSTPKMNMMLMLAGPISVLPLLLFAIAAKRVSLTTIGFMQYIGPTLQFLVGLYFGETLTTAHVICFGFIWTAAAFFIYDAVSSAKKKPPRERLSRRLDS